MVRGRQVAVRRGRVGRSFPARQTSRDWGRTANSGVIAVGPTTKVLLALFAGQNTDVTIRRTEGRLWVQSDQAAVAELQSGAFGAIVVNDVAAALGVTGIQGPATDEESDLWLLHGYIKQTSSLGSLSGPMGVAYDLHSSAMRKLPLGASMALMVENNSASTDFTVSFGMAVLVSH